MRRLLLFGALLAVFGFAWQILDVVQVKVVGQPSMTGPIQSELERPFFESLPQKTGLPIRVDYRTVDSLGFKDNYQLAMMKDGFFDIVSLRFLQNGQEEPTIVGIDLPGLNPDFQTARRVSAAYSGVINESLQTRFGAKLLGIWTFGPQVIFCSKPIKRLSDLKGLKVRVGGASLAPLIKSQGGIPVVIPFDQVAESLALGVADCAVTSKISAYSAGWFQYLSHAYPIATQMGLNGIAIRREVWNQLKPSQQETLMNAVEGYIEEVWRYSEKLRSQASACMQGVSPCELGATYQMIVTPVTPDDLRFMREFALNQSFPEWAFECNKVLPSCGAQWSSIVKPVIARLD